MDRSDYIGSSDIAAIMGESRWKSPLQIWAEKTGQIKEDDLSENEAVELGIELEDFVAKKFEKKSGLKVCPSVQTNTHPQYNYMRANIDRFIADDAGLLECKTCSAWKAKEWEGEDIPREYILQVQWQLGITESKIGYIAVLIGGQSFKYKKVEFDLKLFDKMVEQAKVFWEMVQNKVPPMAREMDNQTLYQMHPESDESMQEVEELNNKVAYLQETKMHIQEMEKEKSKLEAEIKQVIGDNLGIKTSEYTVKWSSQKRRVPDTQKMKDDDIYDLYTKTVGMRVLRVRKEKGDDE